MSLIAVHRMTRAGARIPRLSQSSTQTARYASKAARSKARPQDQPKSKSANNDIPSIPPHLPNQARTRPHASSRQAPRPSDRPEEMKRWEVRQQIGYKGVTWKITQLIVGIPVVIVFGYHLYGRLFLGWEQKVPVRIEEDGKEVMEPIRFVGRDKPGS